MMETTTPFYDAVKNDLGVDPEEQVELSHDER